jgi:hypothetical protein
MTIRFGALDAVLVLMLVTFTGCARSDGQAALCESSQPAESSQTAPIQPFWPVSYPSDEFLDPVHALMPYMHAAAQRGLPLRFFRELIEFESSVTVVEGEWPSYRPGFFYGGTIYMPAAQKPGAWSRVQWASFYNELFHAWYGHVFQKQPRYAQTRALVQTPERLDFYRRAHPTDPSLAQEEAWSETVASVMSILVPTYYDGQWHYPVLSSFAYAIDKTVSSVSHSDRPGYTPQAEQTYPAEWEYRILFNLLTLVQLP